MNLIDQLLSLAEHQIEASEVLKSDLLDYKNIVVELPRLFPSPNELWTRTSDFDLALVYVLGASEKDEPLRMLLSMTFGATEWFGELDKRSQILDLRATVRRGNYSILLKIKGVGLRNYELSEVVAYGEKLVGRATCQKFSPWELSRPDTTPETLLQHGIQTNQTSYLNYSQSKVLSDLATALPSSIPSADYVAVDLGLNYDAEILYINDPRGKKRKYFDKHLGYTGWSASINKLTADFSLQTIIELKCQSGNLKLRISILNACKEQEKLLLIADLPNILVYKAVRPDDPDYDATIKLFGEKYVY